MGNDVRNLLKGMQSQWQKSKEEAGKGFGGNTVPAGTYIFQLSRSWIGQSSSGKTMWFLEHTVTEGEHKGETVFNTLNLEHDVGQQVTCQFCDTMGYAAPDQMADLVYIAERLAKASPVYKMAIKYNSEGYVNCRVMEVLDPGEAGEEDAPTGESDENAGEESTEEPTDEQATDDATGGDDEEIRTQLIEFCLANGVTEITDGSTVQDIREAICGYDWKEERMDAAEIALLESVELGHIIERKPKAKPVAKTPAKAAPAKAATKAAPAAPAKAATKPASGAKKTR